MLPQEVCEVHAAATLQEIIQQFGTPDDEPFAAHAAVIQPLDSASTVNPDSVYMGARAPQSGRLEVEHSAVVAEESETTVSEVAALTRRLEELRPILSQLLQDASQVGRADSEPSAQHPDRRLPENTTTVVVRNIPLRYSRKDIEREWMPNPSINFLELVFNQNGNHHASYAYVNFTSYNSAKTFCDDWHGKFLSRRSRTRPLNVAYAYVQGYQANMWRYHAKMRNLIPAQMPSTFSNGVRLNTRRQLAEMTRALQHQPEGNSSHA